jgi:hypothetical protein
MPIGLAADGLWLDLLQDGGVSIAVVQSFALQNGYADAHGKNRGGLTSTHEPPPLVRLGLHMACIS